MTAEGADSDCTTSEKFKFCIATLGFGPESTRERESRMARPRACRVLLAPIAPIVQLDVSSGLGDLL